MDQIQKKIKAALGESGYDALLVVGADNFAYVTQSVLPFAEHYPDRYAALLLPRNGVPTVFAPVDWAEAVAQQGWQAGQFREGHSSPWRKE